MSDPNSSNILFVHAALDAWEANRKLADKAIAQTSDENLRRALDGNTNSIAVIMKHVAGNLISRWTDFLTTDGEKPWRNRDDEFVDAFAARAEIEAYWEKGWSVLYQSLRSLTAEDLAKSVVIRGEPHSVPKAMQRSLAHTAYHIGQIVMVARILAGEQWETLTVARGESQQFNAGSWGGADKGRK
ncbi:MAG TPA: DinB family protein [Pirellulaceae bacterium]|jgi:uncharacterized damage-inducible protein DinB|nr:DinB family protein [Pirellulaceae bacterium]